MVDFLEVGETFESRCGYEILILCKSRLGRYDYIGQFPCGNVDIWMANGCYKLSGDESLSDLIKKVA